MRQGNLSSWLTAVYKFIFPPAFVAMVGNLTLDLVAPNSGSFGGDGTVGGLEWLVLAFFTFGTASSLFLAIRLRFLRVDDDFLRATSGWGSVLIHPTQIVRADKLWYLHPLAVVRILYRDATGTDHTIWFMPRFNIKTGEITDQNLLPDLKRIGSSFSGTRCLTRA